MQITSMRLIFLSDVANVVTELWTKLIQLHHDLRLNKSKVFQGGSFDIFNPQGDFD